VSAAAQTAFAVKVPQAEACVGQLRARHDPSARLGVPAHVTVLHPFMAPDRVGPEIHARLNEVFSRWPVFDFRLARIARFPGVLYLAPQDDAPFLALTAALVEAFPAYPPYAGRHATVVPHLTVAQADDVQLALAERELLSLFPPAGIACRCESVAMMENASGLWRDMGSFPLAGARAAQSR